MGKHFFTPEYPTVTGAYWLRRKDQKPTIVLVNGLYARDVDDEYDARIDQGEFEGDWLGPIEPKEGIPLEYLTEGRDCASRLDGRCWRPKNAAVICPADTIPDYCPLIGE